jgi:acyl carrier protein
MEEVQGINQVKQWLRARKPEIPDFDLDFDLIENRVIDSLMFFELIFFLEAITGRELDNTQTTHQFRTLRSIRDNILTAEA